MTYYIHSTHETGSYISEHTACTELQCQVIKLSINRTNPASKFIVAE